MAKSEAGELLDKFEQANKVAVRRAAEIVRLYVNQMTIEQMIALAYMQACFDVGQSISQNKELERVFGGDDETKA